MTQIYLDAAPVIYSVEQVAPFAAAVDARLATPGLIFVASDLTRMECRVGPLRAGDVALLSDYESFFANLVAQVVTLTSAVVERATQIRAAYRFRTADSLHLAAAVQSACDAFLTGDRQLARFTDIAVEVVQPPPPPSSTAGS